MATKKEKFPERLLVARELSGNESYLVSYATPDEVAVAGEDVAVAIYKFERLAVVSSDVKLV